MKGWVYIITNKAMPDILKVGFTMKDPELRAIELNHTGSPHPYVVDYEVLVDYPESVEKITHGALSDKKEGKEWFRCSREEAIAAIKNAISNKIRYVETFKYADKEKAEEVWRSQEAERNRKRDAIKRQKEKEDKEQAQKEQFKQRLREICFEYQTKNKNAKTFFRQNNKIKSFFQGLDYAFAASTGAAQLREEEYNALWKAVRDANIKNVSCLAEVKELTEIQKELDQLK